jgi:preprotein translocase subunit SecA
MSALAFMFDSTRRDLARARRLVEVINRLGPEMEGVTEEQMRAKTDEFRDRLAHGASLDDLLPEAYAMVREATWRVLGRRQVRFRAYHEGRMLPEEAVVPFAKADAYEAQLKQRGLKYMRERFMLHFDVQMVGAIMLHWGRVTEMRTGEGKTQVAVPALYLNALEGRGAHLLTHNDYLAKRDRDWMAPIYEMLGLTVGAIQHDELEPELRRAAYDCDITYATNHEVGFDYLRDNTANYAEELVLRGLHYAIVDEADSLLIDEARTPLILAGMGGKPTDLYRKVDRVMPRLVQDTDYVVDEKAKTAFLTDDGMHKVEQQLGVKNISDPENLETFQHVNAALRAHACYRRDVDYVVRDGKVIIVDEFTGRLMYGRRYSEGLHQAIEAKEKVRIERESVTTATITHQNFFRLYDKLAGMTGTAKTEEPEFIKVYDLPVGVIPTHRPVVRKDHSDMIYKTQEGKFHGITAEIIQMQSLGRPTLVGTRSVEMSERLSERLKAERLQLFAQLALLEQALLDAKEATDTQRKELARALQARLDDVQRDLRHLQAAAAKIDQSAVRVAQPEELRRIEQRLARTQRFAEEIARLHGRLLNKEPVGRSELSRISEILCYQPLEEVPLGRPAALLRAFGLDADPTKPENAVRLAALVGLPEGEHERLAEVLNRGVPHRVLNAKYHEMEAHIIAQAGRSGALTIATNMAGRGVDIVLGGNPVELVNDLLRRDGIDPGQATEEQRSKALEEATAQCAADRERVMQLGGLHILGTERHESRRIDNQLRGRSGRQGDPGSSRFYVSFEDELMRLFGPERLDFWLSKWPENEPIEHKLTTKMIENAQKKVEAHNFEIRKHNLLYDDVMNTQRSIIYDQRMKVLHGEDMHESVLSHMREYVEERVAEHASREVHREDWNLEALQQALAEVYPTQLTVEQLSAFTRQEDMVEFLQEEILSLYEAKEQEIGGEALRELERFVTVRVVSMRWIDHLAAMEDLEEGIGLRGYSGVDPLILYRKESGDYWKNLMATIREEIIRYLFRLSVEKVEGAPPREYAYASSEVPRGEPVEAEDSDGMVTPVSVPEAEAAAAAPVAARAGGARPAARRPRSSGSVPKVGRNDPCPCGSGLKYKKCHGRGA